MEHHSDIITKASDFIRDLFEKRLSKDLLYHTFSHTEEVARTTRKIAKGMKLGEEGIEVVQLSALFHDTGYTEMYRGHEEVSVRIATEFLEKERYSEEKIDLIAGCIRATRVPQQPKNLLEEIVADADLAGLGKKSFFEKTELLHSELKTVLGTAVSEEEWIEQNITLLSSHKYFTSYAQEIYGRQQNENIRILRKKLQNLITRKADSPPDPEHIAPLNLHAAGDTFHFNNLVILKLNANMIRLDYTSADHKALMIILVNSVLAIISMAGFGILSHHGYHAAIFAFILFVSSAFSIVYSVRAIRQHVKVENGNDSWPPFGSFNPISFSNPEGEIDFDFYNSLAQDFADHKVILSRKYRLLHRSYTTFMFGLLLTVSIFFILLALSF